MRIKLHAALAVLFAVTIVMGAVTVDQLLEFSTPEANGAVAKYEATVKASEARYRGETEQAKRELIGTLTRVKNGLTGRDADEIVRLEKAIDQLQATVATVKSLHPLHGTKWKMSDRTIVFDAASMAISTDIHDFKGTWAVVSPNTIRVSINRTNCDSYVCKIDGNRITVIDGVEREFVKGGVFATRIK